MTKFNGVSLIENAGHWVQQEKPEDFVIATGQMRSVREFIELCAKELGWNKNNRFCRAT